MIENKFPGKDITESDLKSKFPLVSTYFKSSRSKFSVKGVEFGGERIPFYAGPNMIESKDLIMDIAKNVSESGAAVLRGGAFKPLSFPYRSEKYNETREEGLKWMVDAGEKFNIPIISEIMEERFLPLAKEQIDIIQIGSRNMQNYPFLQACARTGRPLMLKRHYGASLRDWLGAAEYILLEGNSNLILCERGVSVPHTHRATSRFLLDLQVIPAAKDYSHLPIAVDPSHATFWRDWVEPMTLASIAAGADAVMVEVHPDPPNAAVDPLQPINYQEFKKLMVKSDAVAKCMNRWVL
jgi:3-deoxy-7-phosphoheptulonate synthase